MPTPRSENFFTRLLSPATEAAPSLGEVYSTAAFKLAGDGEFQDAAMLKELVTPPALREVNSSRYHPTRATTPPPHAYSSPIRVNLHFPVGHNPGLRQPHLTFHDSSRINLHRGQPWGGQAKFAYGI